MRTITKKFSGLSGDTETFAMDLKVQEHSRQTWEFYATGSANIRIKLKSVFTEGTSEVDGSGSGATAGCDIQTIDLTDDVLTIVNFDMKLDHVRCTYDDDGTGDMSGTLYIKATTAK
jgi:hypothetical protein|tara:strand:+ start:6272 stop:6622 length:351 start_codon:yes stop_codon:yes gene_type:complete